MATADVPPAFGSGVCFRIHEHERVKVTNDAMKAFLIERYKHERLYGRGKEYGDAIVASAIEDLAQYGIGLVSKFESITGRQISYVASDVMAVHRNATA